MYLSEMTKGQSAVVLNVGGGTTLRRRILEMGIRKGARIYIEKYAPLKDPLELVVNGSHISLRVEEAERISVASVS